MSDISILNYADRPIKPLQTGKSLIISTSIIIGLLLSIMFILIKHGLQQIINDPEIIENQLNIPVCAIIPYSQSQKLLMKSNNYQLATANLFALANFNNQDPAIEALRSLRTTITIELLTAQNNLISIMSATQQSGKTFISINLAKLIADTKQRVLVIDADIRRGKINKFCNKPGYPGLAELLSGQVDLKTIIHKIDQLDFIFCGQHCIDSSNLLISAKFTQLLTTVSNNYDLVLLDTPPMLSVTDTTLIARQSATNFLTINMGKNNNEELSMSVNIAKKNNFHINGLILNNTLAKQKNIKQYHYYYPPTQVE